MFPLINTFLSFILLSYNKGIIIISASKNTVCFMSFFILPIETPFPNTLWIFIVKHYVFYVNKNNFNFLAFPHGNTYKPSTYDTV